MQATMMKCEHEENRSTLEFPRIENGVIFQAAETTFVTAALVPPIRTTPQEPRHVVIQKYGVRFLFDSDGNDRQTGCPNDICHKGQPQIILHTREQQLTIYCTFEQLLML